MTNFELLTLCTTFLRGIGAGVIFGVAIMTMPVRKRLGTFAYGEFMKAHYKEKGVKVYAGITVLGLLLTAWLTVMAYENDSPDNTRYLVTCSLVVTILGFVGTAGAFPVISRLWQAPARSEAETDQLLDRFAFWHTISAAAHIIAFILLLVSL